MGLGGSLVFLGCVAGVLAVLAWISDRLERGPRPDPNRKIITRWFQAMWTRPFDAGWFRLFGYGLRTVNHRKWAPFFSERYQGKGAPKRVYVHLGPWCVAGLRPLRKKRVTNDEN